MTMFFDEIMRQADPVKLKTFAKDSNNQWADQDATTPGSCRSTAPGRGNSYDGEILHHCDRAGGRRLSLDRHLPGVPSPAAIPRAYRRD